MAGTFDKAKTYVFAVPIIRDSEVGGSIPLAPTNNSHIINLAFHGRSDKPLDVSETFALAGTYHQLRVEPQIVT